jgi:hypothetical protein
LSTHEVYVTPPEQPGWDDPLAGDSRFTWEYDDGRDRLLADLDLLMRTDEEIAERPDQERLAAEEAARAAEVTQAIAQGA